VPFLMFQNELWPWATRPLYVDCQDKHQQHFALLWLDNFFAARLSCRPAKS
jgi:hypothetical protein